MKRKLKDIQGGKMENKAAPDNEKHCSRFFSLVIRLFRARRTLTDIL